MVVQLATDAQLEAEARARKLEEELRLEKDVWVSSALFASGLAEKGESRIISWRP